MRVAKRAGAAERAHAQQLEVLRGLAATDPQGARVAAMRLIAAVTDGEGGCWYELGMYEGEPQPVRWATIGVDDSVVRRQRDLGLPNPSGDPRLAPASRDSRFVLLQPLLGHLGDRWFDHPVYRKCWQPAGVADQLRMVVYHRSQFIGWIGTFRRPGDRAFCRADLRRAAPIADAVASAVLTAYHAERADAPEMAGDLLLRPDGRIDWATPDLRRWSTCPEAREALRRWVRNVDRGLQPDRTIGLQHVRWSRLENAGGRTRYLVHLQPVTPVHRHQAHVLSRSQREIAELAASGATVPEIGQMLHIAPTTVRSHLRQVYTSLEVASRSELTRALEGLPGERQS
jgi:DNA-binding CsgD family transcriptional regulator